MNSLFFFFFFVLGEERGRGGGGRQPEGAERKQGETLTELVTRVVGAAVVGLLLHVQTPPQPLRVGVVGQRHGVRLVLEVVEALHHGALGARRLRRAAAAFAGLGS